MSHYWQIFWELIVTPFHHVSMIWGIVPLYFGWALNELTAKKANFRTAFQTGFSFIWAAAQWLYPYFSKAPMGEPGVGDGAVAVRMFVTLLILILGVIAFFSGLFKRFPPWGKFLGHTRFSNYFAICIYPMQAHPGLLWNWDRVIAIILFAFPIWIILHFGLMPVRK